MSKVRPVVGLDLLADVQALAELQLGLGRLLLEEQRRPADGQRGGLGGRVGVAVEEPAGLDGLPASRYAMAS